jgi:hypothetical protein
MQVLLIGLAVTLLFPAGDSAEPEIGTVCVAAAQMTLSGVR